MKITFCVKNDGVKACRVDCLPKGVFGKQVGAPWAYYTYNAELSSVTAFHTKEHYVAVEPVSMWGHIMVIPQPAGSHIKIKG